MTMKSESTVSDSDKDVAVEFTPPRKSSKHVKREKDWLRRESVIIVNVEFLGFRFKFFNELVVG